YRGFYGTLLHPPCCQRSWCPYIYQTQKSDCGQGGGASYRLSGGYYGVNYSVKDARIYLGCKRQCKFFLLPLSRLTQHQTGQEHEQSGKAIGAELGQRIIAITDFKCSDLPEQVQRKGDQRGKAQQVRPDDPECAYPAGHRQCVENQHPKAHILPQPQRAGADT